MLEIGSIIAGKLRVETILGKGGMGTVVLATHLQLDERVAVKVIHDSLVGDGEILQRFMREARTLAKVRTEHVCRVRDVGQTESGAPYIVMELLEGQDLARIIAVRPLDIPTTIDYVLQACIAVAEAHSLGIVLRDLKPSNLFVTRRPDGTTLVKVLDFGIAKASFADDIKITQTTAVIGSPGYMSPEHLRSARDVDARSDIWALGVILYEAVSGALPFPGSSITELAVKITIDQPAPLHADPRYVAIVMRCLQKVPEARYQTVAELAAELAALGGPEAHRLAATVARVAAMAQAGAMATPPPGTQAVFVAPSAGTQLTTAGSSAGQTTLPTRAGGAGGGKRAAAVLAGVVLAAAAGAAVFKLVRAEEQPRAGAAAPAKLDAAAVATAPAIPADAAAVAMVSPDAAEAMITLDAASADPHLVATLTRLAADKDYKAMIELGDGGDPDAGKLVADAKQHFIANQLAVVTRFVAAGNCARAKATAGEAAQLVPDDTTLVAKAAACTVKKVAATPAEPRTAADAYDLGQFDKAFALAEAALAKDPKDKTALYDATLAACAKHDADAAKKYSARMTPADRNAVALVCKSDGVAVAAPPKPPPKKFEPEIASGILPSLQPANDALAAGKWPDAQRLAEQELALRPRSPAAQRIAGQAACYRRNPVDAQKYIDQLEAVLRPAVRRRNEGHVTAIRHACAEAKVPLKPPTLAPPMPGGGAARGTNDE